MKSFTFNIIPLFFASAMISGCASLAFQKPNPASNTDAKDYKICPPNIMQDFVQAHVEITNNLEEAQQALYKFSQEDYTASHNYTLYKTKRRAKFDVATANNDLEKTTVKQQCYFNDSDMLKLETTIDKTIVSYDDFELYKNFSATVHLNNLEILLYQASMTEDELAKRPLEEGPQKKFSDLPLKPAPVQ